MNNHYLFDQLNKKSIGDMGSKSQIKYILGYLPPGKMFYHTLILMIFLGWVLSGCATTKQDLPTPAENEHEVPFNSPHVEGDSPITLAEIRDRGELIVGTSITKPFEFHDPETDELVGFDVDLANEIAKSIGVPIKWVEMPFANLLPALKNHKVDMTIAAMYITPEREAAVDFSRPYQYSGLVMVAAPKLVDQIHSIDDLAGLRVGVKIGATGEEVARQYKAQGIPLEIVQYQDTVASFLDLEVGRVDVIFNDYLNTLIYLNDFNSDLQIITDMQDDVIYLSHVGFGIAVHQPNPELLMEINKTIMVMEQQEKIDELHSIWFNPTEAPR
jgi:ABC-type amino acid transport substrate-binding protein